MNTVFVAWIGGTIKKKLESIKLCIYSDGRILGVCVCVCACVCVSPRARFQGRGGERENQQAPPLRPHPALDQNSPSWEI